jgi:anaerobic ribonucleoside-triphosphate reductase activating protein
MAGMLYIGPGRFSRVLQMKLNLSGFLSCSVANGPGRRAVVWVQGCPTRCHGCFNTATWAFRPGHIIETTELADRICATDDIDGVTFSGGEPFCQAEALAELGECLSSEGFSILTFSGFSYDTLQKKDRHSWNSLLSVTDLLVAGPYIQGCACCHPLLASSNQQLIWPNGERRIKTADLTPAGSVAEFIVYPDGRIISTGFPSDRLIQGMCHDLHRCGGV